MKILTNTKDRYILYNFKSTLLCLFFLTATLTQAQIFIENFESPASTYTISQSECSNGGDNYFTRTDGTDVDGTYNNADGTFFAAQDIGKSPCSSSPSIMYFDDIDISGMSSVIFCVDIAEDDDGIKQDWDFDDFLHFNYDIDNTGTFTPMLWIEADPSTLSSNMTENGLPRIDTNFDGDGDGAEITSDFTQYCVAISVTGTTMDLQIEFDLDGKDEDVAIDNLSLCVGSANFTNGDPTSSVNVFSVDATGHQTWLGVEIAPGASWTAPGVEDEIIVFRDVITNVYVDEYSFGTPSCDIADYSILPYTASLPCAPDLGGFHAYARSNGANTGDYKRTTMYNGPFNNENFDDHISRMVGTTGNRVFLVDPTSGLMNVYILTTGKWVTTYSYTDFVGGSGAGPLASANILGVSGRRAHVLGADGTIDTYNVKTGALIMDNTATTFSNGPLAGATLASADIVGSKGPFTVNILEADGTLIEYSIGGKFREDFIATTLTGGVVDGSSFVGESDKIVGTSLNDVFLVTDCNATASIFSAGPANNPEIKNATPSFDEVILKAFPNPLPSNSILTINVQNIDVPVKSTITVMDVVGKVWTVKNIDNLRNGNFEINMAEVPNGLYYVNIRSGAELKILKVVK